jgi:hypothetical protein
MTDNPLTEFFGDTIFAYTDADALRDGELVDISSLNLTFEHKPVNRMTANLFWAKRPHYLMNDEQLAELFAECAEDEDDPINFDMQAFGRDIAKNLRQATGDGRIRNLPPDVWLVENEVQGWTLMYPSDY